MYRFGPFIIHILPCNLQYLPRVKLWHMFCSLNGLYAKELVMKKIIEIHGQRVELYSLDEGHTWSSNPQLIVAYGQRQETLRLEIQQKFARIDDMNDSNRYRSRGFEMASRVSAR
jgi:hypothetical protein